MFGEVWDMNSDFHISYKFIVFDVCLLYESLVSKSKIIQTQENIARPGKIAGNIRPKLCINVARFFVDISGFINSFRFCKTFSLCFIGLQRGHSENPYAKD